MSLRQLRSKGPIKIELFDKFNKTATATKAKERRQELKKTTKGKGTISRLEKKKIAPKAFSQKSVASIDKKSNKSKTVSFGKKSTQSKPAVKTTKNKMVQNQNKYSTMTAKIVSSKVIENKNHCAKPPSSPALVLKNDFKKPSTIKTNFSANTPQKKITALPLMPRKLLPSPISSSSTSNINVMKNPSMNKLMFSSSPSSSSNTSSSANIIRLPTTSNLTVRKISTTTTTPMIQIITSSDLQRFAQQQSKQLKSFPLLNASLALASSTNTTITTSSSSMNKSGSTKS